MLLIEVVPMQKMSALIQLLYAVNNHGYWGIGIREVLASGNIEKLTKLINELREQAADCPATMISIVGFDCYNALIDL
jgi:hypothetical protein